MEDRLIEMIIAIISAVLGFFTGRKKYKNKK